MPYAPWARPVFYDARMQFPVWLFDFDGTLVDSAGADPGVLPSRHP